MKTLVGVAEPQGSLPCLLVVDSTARQRALWREAMSGFAVQHHFCQLSPARERVGRSQEEFPLVGVVINRELDGDFADPQRVVDFLLRIREARDQIPVAITNLEIGFSSAITNLLDGLGWVAIYPHEQLDYWAFVNFCVRG